MLSEGGAPLLRDAGHDVYAPTLTGLGERSHLLHPDIDLDTHITDVVNALTSKTSMTSCSSGTATAAW